jgi:hypothetical protein
MTPKIDMPFSISDLDQLFTMNDFLSNTEELIKKFQPEVNKVLVKKSFFTGHFRNEYNILFDDLIRSLIKTELVDHFPSWTPEELMSLSDMELLKMIAAPLFDQDLYQNNKEKEELQ